MEPSGPFFPLRVPSEGSVAMRSRQPTKPESLGDYVRRKRLEHDPPLSLKDVQRQSGRQGKRIAATYVNKIENGDARKPSLDRLVALAVGLGVPLDELIGVAIGKPRAKSDIQRQRMISTFENLPDEQKDDVLQFTRTLEKKYGLNKSGRRAA